MACIMDTIPLFASLLEANLPGAHDRLVNLAYPVL